MPSSVGYFQDTNIPDTGCLYGDNDRTNREIMEYHAFSIILTLSLAPMLLFNNNLLRFYAPLAKIVNVTICLQILSSFLYFSYYPYAKNEGNCTEMIVGRIFTSIIMFGELHQIYLLANMLGLGNHRFSWGNHLSITLDTTLKIGSLFGAVSLMFCIIYRKSFRLNRNIWTIFAASLQIYFVRLSANRKEQNDQHNMLVGMQSSVKVFDKLSKLQNLLPAVVCFLEQFLELTGVASIKHFDIVTLMLNEVLNVLFYLKVVLIKENADVNVELVDA